jgi:hypothetical protein
LPGIGANHAVPAAFCSREVVSGVAFPLAALAYLAAE